MTQRTQRLPSNHGDGDRKALDYNRLPDPYREWAKIARNFALNVDEPWDKEDLIHNIIERCMEVAELYRQQGKSLTKGGAIRVAQYTRLRFYQQKKRNKRVATVSLNTMVVDDDGYETELSETIADGNGMDLIDIEEWLDLKSFYESRPKKERKAIQKMLKKNWRTLSGHDWRLIKRFREEFKVLA